MAKPIRNSAKAIVIRGGKLLVISCSRGGEDYYGLPGGGQETQEDLAQAVRRECLEETGYDVRVGELVFVRDYIANRHEFAQQDPGFHQVEFMFLCEIAADRAREASTHDEYQTGVEWLEISTLERANLYPKVLKRLIPSMTRGEPVPVYLGAVN